VIDRRTVLLWIERGRKLDYYAILTFSPDVDAYGGYSYDGRLIDPPNRQVTR
jgi:hypothetical protein